MIEDMNEVTTEADLLREEVERLRGAILRLESMGAVAVVAGPLKAENGRLREALEQVYELPIHNIKSASIIRAALDKPA